MEQLIRVEMNDGSICRMAIKAFNMFLTQNKITKFERNDGWVTIGKDMLRGVTDLNSYRGAERRCAGEME
jgi:hypothetical protein